MSDTIKLSITPKNFEAFCTFVQEQVDQGSSIEDAVLSFVNSKPKIPGEGEGVIVILNYGPKSHAVFGADTKTIKDDLMALNDPKKIISFNSKLEYGSGWVIMDKTKLKSVLAVFDEKEISYTEIEKTEFDAKENEEEEPAPKAKAVAKKTTKPKVADSEEEEERPVPKKVVKPKAAPKKATAKAAPKKKVVSDEEEEVEKPAPKKKPAAKAKKDDEEKLVTNGKDLVKLSVTELKEALKSAKLSVTGTKEVLVARLVAHRKGNVVTPAKGVKKEKVAAKAPASKSSATTLKAKKTPQGNYAEEDTGIVFVQAPVGTAGKKIAVAIGVQDPENEEQGLASVIPLNEDIIAECEERDWQYLTEDMMKILKKADSEMYDELTELRSRGAEGEAVEAEEDNQGGDDVEEEEEE